MNIERLGKKLKLKTKESILLRASVILLLTKYESYVNDQEDHKEDAAQFLHTSINEYLNTKNENVSSYLIPYFEFINSMEDNEALYDVIKEIKESELPYPDNKDIVLDMTKDDKKSLGIVLTPQHIADLMAQLINVSENDTLLDTCSGTGRLAMTQQKTKDIICIEKEPYMYALLLLNALLKDINTDSLILGDSFKYEPDKKANKAIINPPYNLGEGLTELDFIISALNKMAPEGELAAIVPMSVAIDCKKSKLALRKRLLENHTLKLVVAMPDELFTPTANTNTCIMVFTAHVPHNSESWFGRWKDDGFTKTKNDGRINKNNSWESIKEQWINQYNNKEVIPNVCCKATVSANDEWCAEAYLETDYSKLTQADFEKAIFNYAIYKLIEEHNNECC